MKYLTVPETVEVTFSSACPTCRNRPAEPKVLEISFYDWINALIDDQELWKTPKDIRAAIKLGKLFNKDDVTPGAVVAVEDADYEKLKKVYEKPSFAYHPQAMRQCVSYMDAFEEVSETKPEEPTNVDNVPLQPKNGETKEAEGSA